MKSNFPAFIALVWPDDGDFDSPRQGYHVTPGDPGGGTSGGVIEATWAGAQRQGIVPADTPLRSATLDQLQAVLQFDAWGPVCDALPAGLDVLVANGRMMTGHYGAILQQCLGFTGLDVDNDLGPDTLGVASQRDVATLIHACHGAHYAYLARLPTWDANKGGWTRRLVAARSVALGLL